MKLIEITWQHRNDFKGILECEHCSATQDLKTGYDDDNYHRNVIPAIKCVACGKRRTEETLSKISDPGTEGGKPVRKQMILTPLWTRE